MISFVATAMLSLNSSSTTSYYMSARMPPISTYLSLSLCCSLGNDSLNCLIFSLFVSFVYFFLKGICVRVISNKNSISSLSKAVVLMLPLNVFTLLVRSAASSSTLALAHIAAQPTLGALPTAAPNDYIIGHRL
jgi:hypothetical protein